MNDDSVRKEFRLMLDRIATELIYNTFDNERLEKAMMKMSRTERIIIVSRIVLGMETSKIAYLMDISLDNFYVREFRA